MALLNTGISLPSLDIEALYRGQSILAMPQRFIVPGKRFVLCPTGALWQGLAPVDVYQPAFLAGQPQDNSPPGMTRVRAWAKCDLCQHFTEADKLAAFSQHTIWSATALVEYLQLAGHVFMAFFQVYHLPEPLDLALVNNGPVGGFVPLTDYLDVEESHLALTEAEFLRHKRQLLDLKPILKAIAVPEEVPEPLSTATSPVPPTPTVDVVNSDDWYDHISRVGNSSDGTTFERLVRKSLQFLGFANSQHHPRANLDHNSTGGAGGLDFFADLPYPVVGECKASKTESVPSSVCAQLIHLGNTHLPGHYQDCVKIIVAAGKLTHPARMGAANNCINVIRPEELQRLVNLKRQYPNAVNLYQLKPVFEEAPFGEAASGRLQEFIDNIWEQLIERSKWIERVRQTEEKKKEIGNTKPVTLDDILLCFKDSGKEMDEMEIKLSPIKEEKDKQIKAINDILIELSSPLLGYLNRVEDGFEFVKSLEIQD